MSGSGQALNHVRFRAGPKPCKVQGRKGASEEEELAPASQSMLYVEVAGVRRNYDHSYLIERAGAKPRRF
jgi:hypothetical protein